MFKKGLARFYKPATTPFTALVSLVTPVYNEDPHLFTQALESWQENQPEEIIAVIDYTDRKCINVFNEFARKYTNAKLVITKIPGKRPALATGIRLAKNEIVALVDSDTIWSDGVVKKALSPFADPLVGGVATKQNVLNPKTVAQKIFDIQLDQRYADDVPFLAVSGKVLTCLSGRTAFYRKRALLPVLEAMVGETFQGQPVISGEDKRLTYLVEAAGWKTAYQSSAQVYTHGVTSLTTFFKQRLRWSRNSWRADLRALGNGWVWAHPALALHLLDKIVQPFVAFLSPIYFFLSLKSGLWTPALVLILWWHLSRSLKIYSHLKRRPQDLSLMPVYIVSNFALGLVKVYTLFTLNHQSWVTRWHSGRLPKFRFFKVAPAYISTGVVLLLLLNIVSVTHQQVLIPVAFSPSFTPPGLTRVNALSQALPEAQVLGSNTNMSVVPPAMTIYEVKPGDSLSQIAIDFDIPLNDLVVANGSVLPQWNSIETGTLLKIPQGIRTLPLEYNYQKKYFPPLTVTYHEQSNLLVVEGRGNLVNLAAIRSLVQEQYIKEVRPKEWLLSANMIIGKGVLFRLDEEEVTWLKLQSNPAGFVFIKSAGAIIDINGVKITSWDVQGNTVDITPEDGRSYIVAKYSSLVRIRNSELAFLGYRAQGNEGASGVSLTLPFRSQTKYLLSGEITNSRFHDNFSGLEVTGAVGMKIAHNQIYANTAYGISAKDATGFLIKNNSIYGNQNGLRLLRSRANIIDGNLLQDNAAYGIHLFDNSESNLISDNTVEKNGIGLMIQSNGNQLSKNNIRKNRTGIYFYETAANNYLITNDVSQNRLYAVFVKTNKGSENFLYN